MTTRLTTTFRNHSITNKNAPRQNRPQTTLTDGAHTHTQGTLLFAMDSTSTAQEHKQHKQNVTTPRRTRS